MVGWTESPKARRTHWLMTQWMHGFVHEIEVPHEDEEDFELENPEEWEIRERTDEGARICDGFAFLGRSGDVDVIPRLQSGGKPRISMHRLTRKIIPFGAPPPEPIPIITVTRQPREPLPRGEPVELPPPPLAGVALVRHLRKDIRDPLARYEVFWLRAFSHWKRSAEYDPIRREDWDVAAGMVSYQIQPPAGLPEAIVIHDLCVGRGCHACLNTGFFPNPEAGIWRDVSRETTTATRRGR